MKVPSEAIRQVYKVLTDAVHLKRLSLRRQMRRAVSKHVFLKQYTRAEKDIVERLAPVFEAQVRDMSKRLQELEDTKSLQAPSDAAHALV